MAVWAISDWLTICQFSPPSENILQQGLGMLLSLRGVSGEGGMSLKAHRDRRGSAIHKSCASHSHPSSSCFPSSSNVSHALPTKTSALTGKGSAKCDANKYRRFAYKGKVYKVKTGCDAIKATCIHHTKCRKQWI